MSTTRLSPHDAVTVALAMCAGLHHAHVRQVLHRDVKPDNVIFAASGRPKVADFGIAKLVGDEQPSATRVGDVLGTPAYMAPEQARGGVLTPATDVYAVGVVLYELLAGRLPFSEDGDAMAMLWRHVHDEPDPLMATAPHTPPAIAARVHRALAKAPHDRPSSAEAFALELAAAAAEAWGGSWLEHADIPVEVSTAVRSAAEGRGRPAGRSLPPPPAIGAVSPAPVPPPADRGAPTVVVSLRTPDPAEERALRLAESGNLRLGQAEVDDLRRLLTGPTDAARLGLAPGASAADVLAAVLAAIGSWRLREDDPFATAETREVCAVAIRACEAIHHVVRRTV
jgi:serine/threonine-protein kinase